MKAGRSFATNGPMLFLTVDGKGPGASHRFASPRPRRIKVATASSATPLDRLEVVWKGKVIHTVTGSETLTASFEFEARETGWIAARAFERPDRTIRFAHTSPAYFEFPGSKGIVKEDARFFVDWIDREMAFYRRLPEFRTPEEREAMLALLAAAREVYMKIMGNL